MKATESWWPGLPKQFMKRAGRSPSRSRRCHEGTQPPIQTPAGYIKMLEEEEAARGDGAAAGARSVSEGAEPPAGPSSPPLRKQEPRPGRHTASAPPASSGRKGSA